jgi:hypothetical protein
MRIQIRPAARGDAAAVAGLAGELAQSFAFYRAVGYEESAVYLRAAIWKTGPLC